jgi:hypothetical protein
MDEEDEATIGHKNRFEMLRFVSVKIVWRVKDYAKSWG